MSEEPKPQDLIDVAQRQAMVAAARLRANIDKMSIRQNYAGYELANAIKIWTDRAIEESESEGRIDHGIYNIDEPGKIGPPRMVEGETTAEFGHRFALGILKFIKEI